MKKLVKESLDSFYNSNNIEELELLANQLNQKLDASISISSTPKNEYYDSGSIMIKKIKGFPYVTISIGYLDGNYKIQIRGGQFGKESEKDKWIYYDNLYIEDVKDIISDNFNIILD
jgi:hypothetical protein